MNETFTVATIDVARFLKVVVDDRVMVPGQSPGKVVAKMDVEGEEFKIIPHLIATRALCSIDVLFVEWHERSFAARQQQGLREIRTRLKSFVKDAQNKCATTVIRLDDESYGRAHENPGLPVLDLSRQPFRR
jgi:hypothetical protein